MIKIKCNDNTNKKTTLFLKFYNDSSYIALFTLNKQTPEGKLPDDTRANVSWRHNRVSFCFVLTPDQSAIILPVVSMFRVAMLIPAKNPSKTFTPKPKLAQVVPPELLNSSSKSDPKWHFLQVPGAQNDPEPIDPEMSYTFWKCGWGPLSVQPQ
ncbi:hypothetical protein CEXT_259911 [Caerostris extrusa]|uniref:Uncharacterized protein n=1 Tax=Caerostris extrusa TaxID=172846 RepID=A0AAV4TQV8_CAEEX|nr:hypothetical protein CEXT_259911 [Caerostris extrusa]